jgi:glycine/D-amino acid oxidase-like deaminating enzyme
VIVEAQRAGFGASGRNGGWVSGFFSGPARVYERAGGRAALAALQSRMLRRALVPMNSSAIRGVYALYRHADRVERRSGRSSRLGACVDALSGRG